MTFSIVSGPATIAGNTVTLTGAGSVTVRASQAAAGGYAAATPVDQTFTVAKAAQTITFYAPPATIGTGNTVTLSATGGASGNAVMFSVFSGPGSISGNSLTLTGTGNVVVRASQAGNANYLAATVVSATTNAANTAPRTPATIDVLGNDSDPDGDTLTLVDLDHSPIQTLGSAIISGNSVTYTPASGFSGDVSFSYVIIDGRGGISNSRKTRKEALVIRFPQSATKNAQRYGRKMRGRKIFSASHISAASARNLMRVPAL